MFSYWTPKTHSTLTGAQRLLWNRMYGKILRVRGSTHLQRIVVSDITTWLHTWFTPAVTACTNQASNKPCIDCKGLLKSLPYLMIYWKLITSVGESIFFGVGCPENIPRHAEILAHARLMARVEDSLKMHLNNCLEFNKRDNIAIV